MITITFNTLQWCCLKRQRDIVASPGKGGQISIHVYPLVNYHGYGQFPLLNVKNTCSRWAPDPLINGVKEPPRSKVITPGKPIDKAIYRGHSPICSWWRGHGAHLVEMLMVGFWMPTGCALSGANSPLLGLVCTVLEGSADQVWWYLRFACWGGWKK